MSTKNEIINKLAEHARTGGPGATGDRRASELVAFINKILANYSQVLGFSEDEILNALESQRDYSAINFYQETNLPNLENIIVFETPDDVIRQYPSRQYRCPSCEGISTSSTDCNAAPAEGKEQCNWKSYGLFGTLGKGLRAVVKSTFLEKPVVYEIFMPMEEFAKSHNN